MNDAINFFLLTSFSFLLITGCAEEKRSVGGEIDAIYWHEEQRYTVATSNANLIEHQSIPPWGYARADQIQLFKDAKEGEKAWYKCNWNWNAMTGPGDTGYCEIHIHSLDELGTADWNHGKFGSGSTTKID